MKKTLLLLSAFLLLMAPVHSNETHRSPAAQPTLYSQLVSVNSEWKKYIDEQGIYAARVTATDETGMLVNHFKAVILKLQREQPQNLSAKQKKNRKKLLRVLVAYAKAKRFPKNYDHANTRKPCFIDADGTVCAVGKLLWESDHAELALHIAATMKYFCLKDMQNAELEQWIRSSGFTLDELALIQPTYRHTIEKTYFLTLAYEGGLAGNLSKPKAGIPEVSYQPLYNWQVRAHFTVLRKKGPGLNTGIGFSRMCFVQNTGADFKPAQYGVVKNTLALDYLAFPLLMSSGKMYPVNHTYYNLGLVSAFYVHGKTSSQYRGSADEAAASTPDLDHINRYIPWIYASAVMNLRLSKPGVHSYCLHLEPSVSLALRSLGARKVLAYQPCMLGLALGLSQYKVIRRSTGF